MPVAELMSSLRRVTKQRAPQTCTFTVADNDEYNDQPADSVRCVSYAFGATGVFQILCRLKLCDNS